MATQATLRKIKRSFTLAPESVAFLSEARLQRGVSSDSETLDLLLQELLQENSRQQLDLAIKAYYDSASEEELTEQSEWAKQSAPNMWVGVPE